MYIGTCSIWVCLHLCKFEYFGIIAAVYMSRCIYLVQRQIYSMGSLRDFDQLIGNSWFNVFSFRFLQYDRQLGSLY